MLKYSLLCALALACNSSPADEGSTSADGRSDAAGGSSATEDPPPSAGTSGAGFGEGSNDLDDAETGGDGDGTLDGSGGTESTLGAGVFTPGAGGGQSDSAALTADALLAAAPLQWPPAFAFTSWAPLSFSVPSGWTATAYTDGVALVPTDEAQMGCSIYIMAPRAAEGTEAGRFTQLAAAVQTLLPDLAFQGALGSDLFTFRSRGRSGWGPDVYGLELQVPGTLRTEPFLVVFGDTAVPVIPLEPTGLGCLYTTATEANWLEVLHSLQLDGFTPRVPEPPLEAGAVGSWFTGDGNVAASLALGANGQYINVSAANGSVSVSPGELQDVSAAWSGDGEYVLLGGLLATFPNSEFVGPSSALFRLFEEENSSAPSGWISRLCLLERSVSGTPYEICYVRR